MSVDAGYYRELITPIVQGRKWVLQGAPLAAFTSALPRLAELGAAQPFIVASGIGTGTVPSPDECEWEVIDIDAPDIITEIRLMARALGDLPKNVIDHLDTWDPDRSALVMGNAFYTRPALAGRRVYGGRSAAWEALEDKVLAHEIWDAAGVSAARHLIVPADRDALLSAAARLDRGFGTVWSGDASEGFNGGAVYVRWIRHSDDVDEAAGFFTEHCLRVRVMPFLEGIPCSIHGIVFPEMTVALRPCELVTLRRPGSRLAYSGSGSHWDPPPTDAEDMRALARRIGEHLRDRADYRGAFTVDGVMTHEGFRPTELNSRAGAAIGHVLGAVEGLPFGWIQRALTEREPLDYRPEQFERLVMDASETHRNSVGVQSVATHATETVSVDVRRGTAGLEAADGEPSEVVGTLHFGPGNIGGFVRFVPTAATTPIGPPIAPLVVEALALADRLWDTGIGPLEPAVAVR